MRISLIITKTSIVVHSERTDPDFSNVPWVNIADTQLKKHQGKNEQESGLEMYRAEIFQFYNGNQDTNQTDVQHTPVA